MTQSNSSCLHNSKLSNSLLSAEDQGTWSLKRLKSQPSTSESPDTSETQTERPEILTYWLQAQETMSSSVNNAGQLVDDSETKPESDIEHLPESPATPAEFTRWYDKVHLQAGSTKQMVDSESEPELEILKQERMTPIDFIYEAMMSVHISIFSILSPLTKNYKHRDLSADPTLEASQARFCTSIMNFEADVFI
ncbi:hypothetical protein BDR03DRAFT_983105 [Suillus americanus]|nr:hypothetical protein BDR03DRAFT_983105 [Suillus americanus]